MISTMLMVFIIVLLFPIVFMDKEERKAFLKKWRQAFRKMCVHFSLIIKKSMEEERELKALRNAKEEFEKAINKTRRREQWLGNIIYDLNITNKNEMYFHDAPSPEQWKNFNSWLFGYSKTVLSDSEYLVTGMTMPKLVKGAGAYYVANLNFEKKTDIEKTERLAKMAEDKNKQDVEEVQSVL